MNNNSEQVDFTETSGSGGLLEKIESLKEHAEKSFHDSMKWAQDRSLDALFLAAIMAIIGFLLGGPVGAVAFAGMALGGAYANGYFDPLPEVTSAAPDAAEHAAKHDVSQQMKALDAEFKEVRNPERQNAINIKRYVRAVIQGKPDAVKQLAKLPNHLQLQLRTLNDYERGKILNTPTRVLAQKLSRGEGLGKVASLNVIDINSSPRNRPRKNASPSSHIGGRLMS